MIDSLDCWGPAQKGMQKKHTPFWESATSTHRSIGASLLVMVCFGGGRRLESLISPTNGALLERTNVILKVMHNL